jgi:hypothetical protein
MARKTGILPNGSVVYNSNNTNWYSSPAFVFNGLYYGTEYIFDGKSYMSRARIKAISKMIINYLNR